jgi:hypothetical protein
MARKAAVYRQGEVQRSSGDCSFLLSVCIFFLQAICWPGDKYRSRRRKKLVLLRTYAWLLWLMLGCYGWCLVIMADAWLFGGLTWFSLFAGE